MRLPFLVTVLLLSGCSFWEDSPKPEPGQYWILLDVEPPKGGRMFIEGKQVCCEHPFVIRHRWLHIRLEEAIEEVENLPGRVIVHHRGWRVVKEFDYYPEEDWREVRRRKEQIPLAE